MVVEQKKTCRLDLQAEDGHSIAGILVDEKGEPVWDVMVTASVYKGDGGTTWSRLDGTFEIKNLKKGTYSLSIQNLKRRAKRVQAETGTKNVRLVLYPP